MRLGLDKGDVVYLSLTIFYCFWIVFACISVH